MNDIAPDAVFAPRLGDDTSAHDLAALADLADLAAHIETPDAQQTGDPAAMLAGALIASGALDAHIERIVRRVLAEYDAQQNVYARRAGGYRPGAFGSIG